MKEKTFLLGVGAQKAGTSWLSKYLSSLDAYKHGFKKEYHIWDAIELPECERFRVSLRDGGIFSLKKIRRRRMQRNSDAYFDYFAHLLAAENVSITGDITPAYAGLSSETYAKIQAGFAARSITCKTTFLMRDPVERCWSAVRMHRKNGSAKEGVRLDIPEEEALIEYSQGNDAAIRTDYEATISRLRNAFPKEHIYLGFYETMFNAEEIERVSSFLGLAPNLEFGKNRFNASPKGETISDECRARVANQFRSTYAYCQSINPQITESWSGFQYLEGLSSGPAR